MLRCTFTTKLTSEAQFQHMKLLICHNTILIQILTTATILNRLTS